MSTEPTPSADLQFDRAEFGTSRFTEQHRCQDCQKLLGDSYYTVDGRVTCFECSDNAVKTTPRQDLKGFPLALIWGAGASLLGSIIYLVILKFTGYEVGLISIAVGWLVGRAMMKGSKGRGGLAYQVLAVLLTYHSIVFSYLVVGIWTYMEEPETAIEGSAIAGEPTSASNANAPAEGPGATATATSERPSTEGPIAQNTDGASANAAIPPAGNTASSSESPASATPVVDQGEEEITAVGLLFTAAYIYVQVLFAPFYDGFSNIIGIAIIAFGLFEAWRHTKLKEPEVSGPFEFGNGPQFAPVAEE